MLMADWLFDICTRCLVQLSSQEHCFDTSYRQCSETHYSRHLTILYQEHEDIQWVTGSIIWCDSSKKTHKHTEKWQEQFYCTHFCLKPDFSISTILLFPVTAPAFAVPLCDSIFRHDYLSKHYWGIRIVLKFQYLILVLHAFYQQ